VGFPDFIFDILFGAACLACGGRVVPRSAEAPAVIPESWPRETHIFLDTRFSFKPIRGLAIDAGMLCAKCWLALEPAGAEATLPEARHIPLITPFYTNGTLLELVRFLKFSNGKAAAVPLAWWCAAALRHAGHGGCTGTSGDVLLIPVPLHAARRRRRGYDQAALLAGCIAALTGYACELTVLGRIRRTAPQSKLPEEKRARNVHGAFKLIRPNAVRGRKIVVVDDLVTTGATAAAAAAALTEGDPASVTVLAVGRVRSADVGAGNSRLT
jgi:ComF family protein